MLNVRSLCLCLCVFVVSCNSTPQGTPIDPSDPLADVCTGAPTVEEITAMRTIFAEFVRQAQPVGNVYAFAFDQCGATTHSSSEFADCLTCLAAAIDEAYEITSSTGTPLDESDPLADACPGITTEALEALRAFYGEFAERNMPIQEAQEAAGAGCDLTPYPGADEATCNMCVNAAIDEAYAQ